MHLDIPRTDVNLVDAAARGTSEGLQLMLNVIAMLISFIALVALLNGGFGAVHGGLPGFRRTCRRSWAGSSVRSPGSWACPGTTAAPSGPARHPDGAERVHRLRPARPAQGALDPRSFTIASFALAGFANFSSIGIQLGGIGALAPERKRDLARLGFRAMLAGTLANFLSATIAGILL